MPRRKKEEIPEDEETVIDEQAVAQKIRDLLDSLTKRIEDLERIVREKEEEIDLKNDEITELENEIAELEAESEDE